MLMERGRFVVTKGLTMPDLPVMTDLFADASMVPTRIQLSRRKGFKLPPNTVNVARPSKWGNPFIVGKRGGVFTALVKDRRHAWQLFLSTAPLNQALVAVARAELAGKNLACWCPLPEPYQDDECHAAVLLKIANPQLYCEAV